jgi:hypothetical protein
MFGWPKTGDKLLIIVESDIKLIFDKFDIIMIAWCADNDPDGKKMRQLLGAKYHWLIMLVCWVYQMNLVVGDFRKVVTLGLNVVKWFNNHSQSLALFRSKQKLTYHGKFWALIFPIITR